MAAGGPPGRVWVALPVSRAPVSAAEEEVPVIVDQADPPRLAAGVELLGELQDSAFAEPQSLIRRADGQVIQLSRLLYLVVSLIDGARGPDEIAALASDKLGRSLSGEQVRYLVTAKLDPLGVLAGAGAPAVLPTASPLLALRARVTLFPEAAACALGTLLRPLFRPPVIIAVVASVAALDFWLFSTHGLSLALNQVLNDPADLLLVAGLLLVSAFFHECGHAAGCRYGGARPGRIGAGIYLVWPAFFTNVTDSYRLNRAGRLRTDLGGVYFNLIFMLALAACYAATSAAILLLAIALTHLELLEQLLPFVRFDGYFILSDLVGVPDLFTRVRPVLRSSLSRWHGKSDPRATSLRPRARIVITAWILCVIPLLTAFLGYLLFHLPEVNRALWQSASHAGYLAGGAFTAHRYAAAAAAAAGGALALTSVAGSLYVAAGLARRIVTGALRWSAGNRKRRCLALAAIAACALPLALYWMLDGQFSDWLPVLPQLTGGLPPGYSRWCHVDRETAIFGAWHSPARRRRRGAAGLAAAEPRDAPGHRGLAGRHRGAVRDRQGRVPADDSGGPAVPRHRPDRRQLLAGVRLEPAPGLGAAVFQYRQPAAGSQADPAPGGPPGRPRQAAVPAPAGLVPVPPATRTGRPFPGRLRSFPGSRPPAAGPWQPAGRSSGCQAPTHLEQSGPQAGRGARAGRHRQLRQAAAGRGHRRGARRPGREAGRAGAGEAEGGADRFAAPGRPGPAALRALRAPAEPAHVLHRPPGNREDHGRAADGRPAAPARLPGGRAGRARHAR
jgi:putative peptide zinc metalloprotease protein